VFELIHFKSEMYITWSTLLARLWRRPSLYYWRERPDSKTKHHNEWTAVPFRAR